MTGFPNERTLHSQVMVPVGAINRAERCSYMVKKPKCHALKTLGFPWILFRIVVVSAVLIGIALPGGARILVGGVTGARDQHPDDAAALLQDLLPSANQARRVQALRAVAQAKDRRFIAPLIDLLRFGDSPEETQLILETLHTFTGKDLLVPENLFDKLMVWYGAHNQAPPPGYTAWKGELHAQMIDPRFREFFYEGAPSVVRIEEA